MKLQQALFLLAIIGCASLTVRAQSDSTPDATKLSGVSADPAPSSVIPDIKPAYVRPTERQKLRSYEFNAFGPYALATAVIAGGFQQATNSPPEWGHGVDAFGVRLASNFGIQLVTVTSHYGLAEITGEDISYYACECKGFFPRFGHAVISTVTARRGRNGHTTFSFSGLASPYVGTMAALAWYPDRFGVKDSFRMGNYNLAALAGWNVVLEFIYGGPHALFGRKQVAGAPSDPRSLKP